MNFKYKKGWEPFFKNEKTKPYFKKLSRLIDEEYSKFICFPEINIIFRIFELLSPENIKVIIIGQDPYHTHGSADGIAFSSRKNITPPSLKNLKKEMNNSSKENTLEYLVMQGVFLYNPILTVRSGEPLSHKNIGWEIFTKNLFKFLSSFAREKIIVLFLGKVSLRYKKYLKYNFIFLEKSHPSPFSARINFLGTKCFDEINNILKNNNKKDINWQRQ